MPTIGARRRTSLRLRALLAVLLVLGLSGLQSAPAGASSLPCDGPNPHPSKAKPHKPDNGYTRTAADQNTAITPDEAIARGRDWIDAHLTYCQSGTYPDRHGTLYRTDCSGFVTMTWQSDPPGYTAWTSMYAIAKPIPWSDLRPGDAVHNSGHIELVEEVTPTTVKTLGFGHSPPEEEVYSWAALTMTYDEAIRYNKMQVVSDDMVVDWLRDHVQRPIAHAQPSARTYVGLDTIFWADDQPYDKVVTLPQASSVKVRIHAEPATFDWDFGDDQPDSTLTTHDGGRPYPDQTIVHRYETRSPDGAPLRPTVDVHWGSIWWEIVGQGPRHDVAGGFTLTRPGDPLVISELHTLLGGWSSPLTP